MKIYTKTGDYGQTSLIGKRVSKADFKIELIGQIDELMVLLGQAIVCFEDKSIDNTDLKLIYKHLFIMQTIIADSSNSFDKKISDEEIIFLESKIDRLFSYLPELNNFIYYTGDKLAVFLHFIRTKVRSLERLFVSYNYGLDNLFLVYLNRLSDYFYCLARYINVIYNKEEEIIKF